MEVLKGWKLSEKEGGKGGVRFLLWLEENLQRVIFHSQLQRFNDLGVRFWSLPTLLRNYKELPGSRV